MNLFYKLFLAGFTALFFVACEEIRSYPDSPIIEYKTFNIYSSVDPLGNNILVGQLKFDFTDGDGDLGIKPDTSIDVADSLKYNLFLSLYSKDGNDFEKVKDLPSLNYRIPYIEREGQNKTLKGTITVELEYKTIEYDTIFYSFYIMDRQYNKSNTDSTEIIIFTGISFDDISLKE